MSWFCCKSLDGIVPYAPENVASIKTSEVLNKDLKSSIDQHHRTVDINSLSETNLLNNVNLDKALELYKHQVDAIWSQEAPLLKEALENYLSKQSKDSTDEIRILDIGCGTGEIITRLVGKNGLFKSMVNGKRRLLIEGIELDPSVYALCQQRLANLNKISNVMLKVHHGSATALPFQSERFHIVLNRHMLHCVPKAVIPDILREIYRVLKPHGIVHFVAEDIEMLYTSTDDDRVLLEQQKLWCEGIYGAGVNIGVDLKIGRKLPSLLIRQGLKICLTQLALVDTYHSDRNSLVAMFELWRQMYTEAWQQNRIDFKYHQEFSQFVNVVQDKSQYISWHIPIIQAMKVANE